MRRLMRVLGADMPRPVLRLSLIVAISLLVPLVVAFLVGDASLAMAVGLGYTGAFVPALLVPWRFAIGLTIPAVLATLLGALLAGLVALWIARLTREHERAAASSAQP